MTDLMERLGPRAVRRMTPRAGIALGGAGALIAVGGAVGLGGNHLTNAHGDVRRIPGIVVSLALIAIGIVLLSQVRSGPIAAAGATAEALGVPTVLFFATVDNKDFPPFSVETILLVSAIVWLIAYVVQPSRGRIVFLVLAVLALPLFVMEAVEDVSHAPLGFLSGVSVSTSFSASTTSSSSGFDETGSEGNVIFDDEHAPGPESAPSTPDPTNLGIIALLFGAAYAAGSFVLSRRHFAGTATPLAAVGSLLLLAGAALVSGDLHEVGSGLLLVVIGLALAFVGASSARRFTTWFGALAFALGVIVLVAKTVEGASQTVVSLAFIVVGAVVVAAAHLATTRFGEPAEEDERRSFCRDSSLDAPEAGRVPGL